jgi:hypothetical protein
MNKYVIASTGNGVNETYIFPATEDGFIDSFDELGGLAERWGDTNWYDHEAAIIHTFGENVYEFVKTTESGKSLYQLKD